MHYRDRFTRGKTSLRAALLTGIALSACCLSLSATPALAQSGPVSPVPATGTPTLADTGATQQIRQLVQCGGTIYAVGTFTEISGFDQSTGMTQTFARNDAFSFSATAPYAVTSWNPDVTGTTAAVTVNSIAVNSTCTQAYLGGQFTEVGGAAAKNIASVDTTVGALFPGFKDNSSGQVNTLLLANGHLLTGGFFKGINGSSADPYYASLNPTTGKNDGFLDLNISGDYVYKGVKKNSTMVYNQQLSPDGTLLLVEGDFTSVGGLPRQQIFMLNLTGPTATVTPWSSPAWDGSDPTGVLPGDAQYGPYWQCGDSHPFYIQAASWSPDESTVYIADTGYKPINWNGVFPVPGICDSVSAIPATQAEVEPAWTNYDGCNSMYSTAADSSAVYVGGHERWANDQNGCKHPGAGFVNAPGMAGFTPGTSGGTLLLNSRGNAGLYSRSRGRGADDMLLTSAGLWIASDNFGGGTSCGGEDGFSGLCFLPYPS